MIIAVICKHIWLEILKCTIFWFFGNLYLILINNNEEHRLSKENKTTTNQRTVNFCFIMYIVLSFAIRIKIALT